MDYEAEQHKNAVSNATNNPLYIRELSPSTLLVEEVLKIADQTEEDYLELLMMDNNEKNSNDKSGDDDDDDDDNNTEDQETDYLKSVLDAAVGNGGDNKINDETGKDHRKKNKTKNGGGEKDRTKGERRKRRFKLFTRRRSQEES